MAEILRAFASGVSVAQLAGNITSAIIKLKGYCDQVEDAPDDIAFLISKIENRHLMLHSILESQVRLAHSHQYGGFLEPSIKLCQNASKELNGLVDILAKGIHSKLSE